MDLTRYADLYLTESREHLSAIDRLLLELEHAPESRATLDGIFRAAHTIKGMSATMGFDGVTRLTHEMESALDRLRRGEQRVTPAVIDGLFEAADRLADAIEQTMPATGDVDRVLAGEAAGKPADEPAHRPSDPLADRRATRGHHVKVDGRRLDALMSLVGELAIARERLTQLAGAGDAHLQETVLGASRLITRLQDEILATRMVPVAQLFERFPRMVRDAARGVGKQVDLIVSGGDIELDRSLLDEIGEPVMHLLRNAVAHGIEAPNVRLASGKPAAGRVELCAERQHGGATIRVTDDGRGIDTERVLRVAEAEGLVSPGTRTLPGDELVRLVSLPGFSTAGGVTELSGRGVGIDAVLSRVRAIGGMVEIRSREGSGTTVTIRVPATIAIVQALVARIGEEVYAIPLTHVRETADLGASVSPGENGASFFASRGAMLPLLRLRAMLDLPPLDGDDGQVIVVEAGERRAALVVDEITAQREIVVKRFDAVRGGRALFSGATILPDGAPALIVDVGSLF